MLGELETKNSLNQPDSAYLKADKHNVNNEYTVY